VWQAQVAQAQAASHAIPHQHGQGPPAYSTMPASAPSSLYPSLTDYMGLAITPEMVSRHAVVPACSRQVCGLNECCCLCIVTLQLSGLGATSDEQTALHLLSWVIDSYL